MNDPDKRSIDELGQRLGGLATRDVGEVEAARIGAVARHAFHAARSAGDRAAAGSGLLARLGLVYHRGLEPAFVLCLVLVYLAWALDSVIAIQLATR